MEKPELTESNKKALLDLIKQEIETAVGRKALEYGSGSCSLAEELIGDLEYLACTDRSGAALAGNCRTEGDLSDPGRRTG